MTCISLHKEGESKKEERWNMEKEKRKNESERGGGERGIK